MSYGIQNTVSASLNLFSRIAATIPATGDVCFSPLPVLRVNGMLAAGAKGSTRDQILRASGCENPSEEEAWRSDLRRVARELSALPGLETALGTRLWLDSEVHVLPTFADAIREGYGCDFDIAEFRSDPETSRKEINTWVDRTTKKNIKDLIPEGMIKETTRMVVAAALYCNAPWALPFDPLKTDDQNFHLAGGKKKQVRMMKLEKAENEEGPRLPYLRDGDLQAIRLPYVAADFAMTVFLPSDPSSLETLEKELPERWAELDERLSRKYATSEIGKLWLPRFDSNPGTVDLKDVLKGLEMTDAFTRGIADFTGITQQYPQGDLLLTDYVTKARNITAEKGSKMSAASAAVGGLECLSYPKEFLADRPFLWVAAHRGFPVFLGRTANPQNPE